MSYDKSMACPTCGDFTGDGRPCGYHQAPNRAERRRLEREQAKAQKKRAKVDR